MGELARRALAEVPKDMLANLQIRRFFFTEKDKARQDALWQTCADGEEGFLFWLRSFCWTYNPNEDTKHIPFIPWDFQDKYATGLWQAIDQGHDILGDKSREMGASWLCLYAMDWWFLFVPDSPFLAASRNERYVDVTGNPDCLFWKLDYNHKYLPVWMRPKIYRRVGHILNEENGSVIDGETTNDDLGRGGSRKAILLDEFAAVEHSEAILAATADAAPCRIFNSTPQGMGNAFANVRFSGKVKIITLPWWDHPFKGKDRREIELPDGTKKWTSPWYEKECGRRTSLKEIAQELDINYLASGDTFFDLEVLQRIRGSGQLRDPDLRGEVEFKLETKHAGEVYRVHSAQWAPSGADSRRGGRLSLWCPLRPDFQKQLRPEQDHNYVAFADISNGQGQSNSVLEIFDANSGEQVGEWVCADTPPDEFAFQCVAICQWFGGANGHTFLGWENNGPGLAFGPIVIKTGYAYYYYQRDMTRDVPRSTKKWGWTSTSTTKNLLFSEGRGALARREVILHSTMLVTELEAYIFGPGKSIIPSKMAEESSTAQENHGDRGVAFCGTVMMLHEQPKAKPPDVPLPPGSYGWRQQQERAKQREKKRRW